MDKDQTREGEELTRVENGSTMRRGAGACARPSELSPGVRCCVLCRPSPW